MSTALMPMPNQQFFSANGVPLAGGFIYTYAAGTMTPQAAYTDASGDTPLPNPIVLDAGGSASIWLGALNYKIVAQDANGVTQWTIDNVSAVSLPQLQAASTFASLAVTGNATVGGNETVSGSLTAASETITGTANIQGALTAASAAVAGNETVGGTLSVTGATTLAALTAAATTVSSLNIGAQTLTQFVQALIPALTALAGTLVISNIAVSGNWVIFTFGGTAGTRIQIGFGAGTLGNGSSIPLPSGFSAAQMIATATLNALSVTSGNQLDNINVSISAGVVTATSSDNSGHSFVTTANWMAVAWVTGV